MIILMILIVFFSIVTGFLVLLYLRQSDNIRLDRMGLQNLIDEKEKQFYINEYKKILTAKFIYERFAEEKSDMDITREVIKAERNVPVVEFFPEHPGVPAEELTKIAPKNKEEK